MTDETSMWDDPHESSALRQLLRAGRVENSDYNVEVGLARHLAQLQGGAPLPAWAAAQSTLQKSASWSILAWLLPPVISAGVVGAWLALRPADPPPASFVVPAPQPAAAPVTESSTVVARPESAALQEPTLNLGVGQTALSAAHSANPAAEASANQDQARERDTNDHHDQHARHDHVAAAVRTARQPVRPTLARRGRAGRSAESADSASTYGAAPLIAREGSLGSGAGLATASTTVKPASDESGTRLNNKASGKAETTAAVQESAPAPTEDAKAKTERRTKEEDRAARVDEVSGARLEREMRMLAVAQRVLTEDPARSLRLCRQGESEFRGSMFSAERKQVALLALVQLGKVDQARREGIPFLRAFPNAPWSARLREALSSGRLPNR
jgi:hypothetical protein